ncbi:PPE family protein [Mycobacterium haemophilum]|uniref:PPE family protein n=1 Tax=Mycobacterium haemophilum TaxID=29311 RepID=A0A0I9U8D8_9MYCO|nr:PPE family protein [Mycobacterium haemophilum]KLO30352.1 hypothetical protein ABH39_10765 [Mycobacterium haemophilum]KLO37493.1 hypothetical protein ABH38_07955 [Mycobacterium haemophilum]KLO44040.1 hypothetical protein ABH37_05480 [Mycobacterium haemophilum]KLO49727.1 hypothetical protein ABH36_11210 [Mycobacterium haemophilum]
MALDFSWLPPEINSARIFAGAGSGPLFVAAAAWDGLASDLQASASSFASVIAGLASGQWAGPASVSMAAAATPYVGWLSAAAGQAELAASQARAAATAFESALAATVPPVAVTANRTTLSSLLATNIFGINAPAIAATEFQYVEMWAQDVAAMVAYFLGATSVASTLTPFSAPPLNLAALTGVVSQAVSDVSAAGLAAWTGLTTQVQSAVAALPGAVSTVESLVAQLPLSQLSSVAQVAAYPASMAISPLMSLMMQGANGSTAALAGSTASLGADVPKFAGTAVPDMKPLGGVGGGLGSGMSAGLGQARLVGAMSVPPTWQGSMPARMVSSAMSGLGAMPAAMAEAPTGGGMPMMPMPMGMGGGGGMPGGMMGRGGASPHVVQSRPSVVPRTGVG